MRRTENRRLGLLVLVFGLFAVFISLWLTQTLNPRHYDFAALWQASRMTLAGENVYDSRAWLSAREHYQTALHSETVFQYPLPLALLLAPLAFLPVEKAYFVWMLFNLILHLLTLVLLLSAWPQRPAWLEVTLVAGSFLFRPVYSALIGGQILFFWLFALVLACWLLQRGRNWAGGALLAALLLKPSIGLPFVLLFGAWLLWRKNGAALTGLLAGSLGLLVLGIIFTPAWLWQYLSNGGMLMKKYQGIQVTLWGAADQLLNGSAPGWLGALLVTALLAAASVCRGFAAACRLAACALFLVL